MMPGQDDERKDEGGKVGPRAHAGRQHEQRGNEGHVKSPEDQEVVLAAGGVEQQPRL